MQEFSDKIKLKKELDAQAVASSSLKVYKQLSGDDKVFETSSSDPCAVEIFRILSFFGMEIPELPSELSDPEDIMHYIMTETGLMRRQVRLTKKWERCGAAPLLCYKNGRPSALIPEPKGGYVYYSEGKEKRVTKKNAAQFSSDCYCFYAPFDNRKMTVKDFAGSLCRSFAVSDVIWLLAVSLLAGLLGLILPYINKFVFHSVVPSGTSKEITGIMILIAGAVIIQAFCGYARSMWVLRIGNKMQLRAQNAIWARLFSLPAGFFRNYSSGELTQRAESVNTICETLSGQLIPTILGSVFSFIYLFQITSISSNMLLPSLIIIILRQHRIIAKQKSTHTMKSV